jgi:hypothetical protein
MAIAAMIKMIATTISNSISEKPFCFRILYSLISGFNCVHGLQETDALDNGTRRAEWMRYRRNQTCSA